MRNLLVGLLSLALVIASGTANAAYRITFDPGGRLDQFIEKYDMLRVSGAHVIIDGECISACTMITAFDPDKVCITKRAALGFHSAFTMDEDGKKKFSADGTDIIWHVYPQTIRDMLRARGWDGTTPHERLIWLDYDALHLLYKDCTVTASNS